MIIAGNRRISTETIEQEIVLREGEPFGEAAVAQSRANLNALELFRRVQIEALAQSGETRRDVLVQVEEAPADDRWTSAVASRAATFARPTGEGGVAEDRFELTPRGSFQVSRRNLWGKNRSITLATRVALRTRDTQAPLVLDPDEPIQSNYGFHEYRVLTSYREPRVFRTTADLDVTGIIEQDIRSSFDFSRRVIQAQLGKRLSALYTVDRRLLVSAHETLQHQSHGRRRGLADRSAVPAGAVSRSSRARSSATAATRAICSIRRTERR